MSRPKWHDECISAVHSYYAFLSKFYIDPTSIISPPPAGWPSITPSSMSALDKSSAVISVLQHLPYLLADPSFRPEIAPLCKMADWNCLAEDLRNGYAAADVLTLTQGYEGRFGGKIPRHCVGLTVGGRDFECWMLDTEEGFIYWFDCPDKLVELCDPRPAGEIEEEEVGAEGQEDKQDQETCGAGEDDDCDEEEGSNSDSEEYNILSGHPYWTPHDFFAMLKNHAKALNLIPINAMEVADAVSPNGLSGTERELLETVFRKHGWPDLERYQKEACLKEAAEVFKGM